MPVELKLSMDKNFANTVKVAIIIYLLQANSLHGTKKICRMKHGKLGENFLLAKISSSAVAI